jgi:hypothetical protein
MEDREWDGVIRHITPGPTGYKARGCRCDECYAAGLEILERDRIRDRAKRAAKQPPNHGLNGYRSYGCRCAVCADAGRKFNAERKAATVVTPLEPIDWDEVAHLKPGYGVRGRRR